MTMMLLSQSLFRYVLFKQLQKKVWMSKYFSWNVYYSKTEIWKKLLTYPKITFPFLRNQANSFLQF
jgi:hypothetical protein